MDYFQLGETHFIDEIYSSSTPNPTSAKHDAFCARHAIPPSWWENMLNFHSISSLRFNFSLLLLLASPKVLHENRLTVTVGF